METTLRDIKKGTDENHQKDTGRIFCPECSKPIDRVPYGKSWRLCMDKDGLMHVLLICLNEKRINIKMISE